MSTISFNVVAHDLASRTFRGVGNAALAMAAKIKAADGATARAGTHADRSARSWARYRTAVDRTGSAMERLQKVSDKLTGNDIRGQGRLWYRLIIGAIATAPSVIGPAVVALGSLLSSIVAVVPGAVALAGAMAGVWGRIKAVAAGEREATGALKRAADALAGVKKSYQGFLSATQGHVAPIFTQLFKGASDLLPRLVPMTNRFADVFVGFLRHVRQEMSSPAFGSALKWLERIGSLVFKNVLNSGENLVKFFYNLARAFDKAGTGVDMKWLANLTKGMNDWAKSLKHNKAFQEFVDFSKREWPKVAHIFENLSVTLGKMFKGMEPISGRLITILDNLTTALAKISPSQWTKIGQAFIALSLGVKALGAAMATIRGVGSFLALLKGLNTFFGKGGGKHSSGGGGLLGGLGKGGKLALLGRGGVAGGAYGLGAWLLSQYGFVAPQGIPGHGGTPGRAPGIAGKVAPGIAGFLRKYFGNMSGKQVTKTITVAFKTVGLNVIRQIPKALRAIVSRKTVTVVGRAAIGAWRVAKTVLATVRSKTVTLIGRAATAAWRGGKALLASIKNRVVKLIATAATGAWSKGKALLLSIKNRIVKLTATAVTSAWSRGKALLLSIKNRTVTLIGRALTGAWSAAKGLLASIRSKTVTVTSVFNTVKNTILHTITGRAAGGPVKRNTPYVVGEVGPELFVPDTGGRIVPNHRMPGMASRSGGGGGGGDTYVVNVHGAVDPVSTGREVQKALLALKRNNGGRALGLT